MTKSRSVFKRLGAMVMALTMVCSMAVAASAAEVKSASPQEKSLIRTVSVLKAGKTEPSMAQDIVAGTAEITTTHGVNQNGDAVITNVLVEIPIVAIEDYRAMIFLPKADGWLQSFSVAGATEATVTNKTGDPSRYTTATLKVNLPVNILAENLPANYKISVVNSNIALYYANSTTVYLPSHITPNFDIVLN